MTELEHCRAMSDSDLIEHIKDSAMYRLWPAVQVLVRRVTVQEPICKPKPKPPPPKPKCTKCIDGISLMSRKKCPCQGEK